MTREEALNILHNASVYHPDYLDALNMAIKALEQEPTTKNDLGVDCISREDARKAIIDYQYSDRFCEEHNIDHSINTSVALIVLGDLPPVTPQEPKAENMKRFTNAKWIDFFAEQFDISRTSAKEMLHVMMSVKKEDNFKKQFNKSRATGK